MFSKTGNYQIPFRFIKYIQYIKSRTPRFIHFIIKLVHFVKSRSSPYICVSLAHASIKTFSITGPLALPFPFDQ